jgi:hypothetical protein
MWRLPAELFLRSSYGGQWRRLRLIVDVAGGDEEKAAILRLLVKPADELNAGGMEVLFHAP